MVADVWELQGIPVPVNHTTLDIPWPKNAASATLKFGSLGHTWGGAGSDPQAATIGIIQGRIVIGLSEAEIALLADPATTPRKVSARDLAVAVSQREHGGTTVAATAWAAARAGIDVFATGGIGGVHRGAAETFDISADLQALATSPVAVVCTGAKLILDLPKTVEALESLIAGIVNVGPFPVPFAPRYGDVRGQLVATLDRFFAG